MPSLPILMVSLSIVLAFVFGVLGLVLAFKHAKDIFTPTRKSMLISGTYFILASLSCTFPTVFVVSDTINLFGIMVVAAMVLLPVLFYIALGYLYAVSQEKKN